MKLAYVTLLAVLVLAATATAADDACESVLLPATNCSVVTPQLGSCTNYTYTIFLSNGTVVENMTLSAWDDGQYQHWMKLNLPADYVIRYCDGTTAQVFVTESQCTVHKTKEVGMTWVSVGMMLIALLMLIYNSLRTAETLMPKRGRGGRP